MAFFVIFRLMFEKGRTIMKCLYCFIKKMIFSIIMMLISNEKDNNCLLFDERKKNVLTGTSSAFPPAIFKAIYLFLM